MQELARLKDLAISDSGFVFDPYTGNTFSINATGRTIIEGLRLGYDRPKIVALLCERFETANEDIDRDVDDFVGILRGEEILPTDFVL